MNPGCIALWLTVCEFKLGKRTKSCEHYVISPFGAFNVFFVAKCNPARKNTLLDLRALKKKKVERKLNMSTCFVSLSSCTSFFKTEMK